MKKTVIALVALTSALFAISCQKENGPEMKSSSPMTICAVTEGLSTIGTKTEMACKYDILWCDKDQILVKNASDSATFKLVGGAGTTKGIFTCEESPFTAGENVEAYYPESIVSGADLIWPATQANNQTVPMYCKQTISATETQNYPFASLGSMLQLIFNSTTEDIVLKSIEVKANEAMSGKFTVNENGQAVISQQEGDKPGITLDLGDDGVALGTSAKKFNIAVPAGTYTDLTITLTADDGTQCAKHATVPQTIQYNNVSTLTTSGKFIVPVDSVRLNETEMTIYTGNSAPLTATIYPENAGNKNISWKSSAPSVASVDQNGRVSAVSAGKATITATTENCKKTASCEFTVYDTPAGALPGMFSISDDNGKTVRKVIFSKGNLYFDGSLYKFEDNQYDTPKDSTDWDKNHVSHFFWSKTASVASAKEYHEEGQSTDDLFFTNAEGFTVNEGGVARTGWRTLSRNELRYLLTQRTMRYKKKPRYTVNITYCGMPGLVLYPDYYSGPNLITGKKYTEEDFPIDCVFLPTAGCRPSDSPFIYFVGAEGNGYYWTSSTYDVTYSYCLIFGAVSIELLPIPEVPAPPRNYDTRDHGSSIRLVRDCPQ